MPQPERGRLAAPFSVRQADQGADETSAEPARGPARGRVVRRRDRAAKERPAEPRSGPAGRRLVRQADRTPRRERVDAARALVIGCGALARELVEVTATLPGVDVACLSPDLHNRPGGIPGAVRARIQAARSEGYERIFIAYADCGTGGLLEPVLATEGVERLPGAHCYEFFAGSPAFEAMAADEPGTFWLTDFLARNFERLVIHGLGIDRHPELEAVYFAHYRRVVYLSQADDPDLLAMARRAADRLGLAFEHRPTGIAGLAAPIVAFAARVSAAPAPDLHLASTSDTIDRIGARFEPPSVREPVELSGSARQVSGVGNPADAHVARPRGTQIGARSAGRYSGAPG